MNKNEFNVRAILAGEAATDASRSPSRAGCDAARLQGRHLVRAPLRRLGVPPGAGGRAQHAAQLHRRDDELTAGCAVVATGTIVPSPAKGQPFEMQASAIKVVGWVDDPDTYPISPKRHTMEYLRDVAHLRPRTTSAR